MSKTALDHAETYDYDKVDRLESVVRTGAGARDWSFGYDAVGNRRGRTASGIPDGGSGTVAGSITASYNDRNELESYGAGGTLRVRGSIDEPGTVSVWTSGTGYVPARMVDEGTPSAYEFEADVPVASGSNQFKVKALDGSANPRENTYNVTVPADTSTFQYDLAGNQTEKVDAAGTWAYEWNGEGQLTRVTLNAVEVARFTYDPFGRRAQKVAGAVTTTWAYDGDDIVQEVVVGGSGAGTYRYVHGPGIDEPLARETTSTGALEYFHADGLGSIVATTSQAGATVSTRRYDAWGNLEVGATTAGYAFTGREWDPEIGLYYYRARYYDAKVGRFIREDPAQFGATDKNFYAYVGNNPLMLKDPSGEDWVSATENFIAGVGLGSVGTIAGSYLVGTATAAGTALSAVAAGGAATVGAAAGAVALVGYGAYQGTIALQEAVLGIDPYTGLPLSTEDRIDIAASLAGGIAGGGAAWKLGTSPEFTFSNKNLRIAPFGNRTIGKGPKNRLLRELPHYHRRGIGPDGVTCGGQGIGRHRPLQGSLTDRSFWDRF